MREVLFYLFEKRLDLPTSAIYGDVGLQRHIKITTLKMALENRLTVVESVMSNRFIHSSEPLRRLSEEICTFGHSLDICFGEHKLNKKDRLLQRKSVLVFNCPLKV